MHKEDIINREYILLIMRSFYDKLLADSSISHLFTEIAQVDLEDHFPRLVDFWDSMLFWHADLQSQCNSIRH